MNQVRLSIFSMHVATIAMSTAPNMFYLSPYHGLLVTVRIEPHTDGNREWDRVYVNGRCVGNRHGAIAAYTRIVNEANPRIVLD